MVRVAGIRAAGRLAWAVFVLWLAVGAAAYAAGADRRQNEPGQFDFYVLSLSWSPSFCEASGERGTPPQQQCGARPYSFVVHGLWPQYENGFPEFCQRPAPRLNRCKPGPGSRKRAQAPRQAAPRQEQSRCSEAI